MNNNDNDQETNEAESEITDEILGENPASHSIDALLELLLDSQSSQHQCEEPIAPGGSPVKDCRLEDTKETPKVETEEAKASR